MRQASLTRRLFAGAASLAVGFAGMLALATPAQAGGDHMWSRADFDTDCEGTWVFIHSGSVYDSYNWSITVDGEAFDAGVPLTFEAGGGDAVFVPLTAGSEVSVDFEGSPNFAWPKQNTWSEPEGGCEPPATEPPPSEPPATEEPTPSEEPEEPVEPKEPELLITDKLFFGCDLFVFALRNDGEKEGVTLTLSPNQDATHGHAPDLIELIDVPDGEVEIPEDFALDTVGTLGGGEEFSAGPLDVGDAHAHGFEPFEGLVVTATVTIGEETLDSVEISWDALLEEDGTVCDEDGGEGGELPVTGTSTWLIAGGALALLAVGAVLFLVARRRRITFTA